MLVPLVGTLTTCFSLQGLVKLPALKLLDVGLKSPMIMNRGLTYFLANSIKEVVRWSVSCCTAKAPAFGGKYNPQITIVLTSRGSHLGLAETHKTSRPGGTSSDRGVADMSSLIRIPTPPQSLTLLFFVKILKPVRLPNDSVSALNHVSLITAMST